MKDKDIFIVGANGQLGTALRAKYPDSRSADIDQLDITDRASVEAFDWSGIKVILNAAAYTNVDGAETAEGRIAAWQVNAGAVAHLVSACLKNNMILVHISSDYVFDGSRELHNEEEPYSPLGVYAQSKAAGDVATSILPHHYIIRTSWVIGSGGNFVRSIFSLGQKDINPNVVSDQFGRITFTSELVRAIDHLLSTTQPFGTYNVSNGGDIVSWADIAREVYMIAGYTHLSVGDTTAAEYFAGKLSSPRPEHSGLDMSKIHATGFESRDWRDELRVYIEQELKQH